MRRGVAIAIAGLALLQGCGRQTEKRTAVASSPPKWEGYPFHVSFPGQAAGLKGDGEGLPDISYSANPASLPASARILAAFVVGAPSAKDPRMKTVCGPPIAISSATGTLPLRGTKMELSLGIFLAYEGAAGGGALRFALAKECLGEDAKAPEIEKNRLSEWLPLEVRFENNRFYPVR